MLDTELRYRPLESGLEFRGEYVQAFFGHPENLRANNDGDSTNNVGDTMFGYSFEGAYHFDQNKKMWEIVPFYRYTVQNLQAGGFSGSDEDQRTGSGKQQFHTFGVALFPTPKLVLKFDYQLVLDDAPHSPKSDHFLGSLGFFF